MFFMAECSHNGCNKEVFNNTGECIFHCKKTDWYEELENGEKIWKEDLVKKFREEILEEYNNYQYFSIIFPPLTIEGHKGQLLFNNCTFLGKCIIQGCFLDSVMFNNNAGGSVQFDGVQFSSPTTPTMFASTLPYSKQTQYSFINASFTGNTIFRNCDLSNSSFLNSNIEKVNFENCIFWNENDSEKKIYDEKNLEKTEKKEIDYKNVERIYVQLQENFAKNGNISESLHFATGKYRVATNRISQNTNDKQKQENMIMLSAEMKRRLDDLTLYNEADEYYAKEFKERASKSKNENKFLYVMYSLYEYFSFYNNSPLRALSWIIGTIVVGFIIYWISPSEKNAFSLQNIFEQQWEVQSSHDRFGEYFEIIPLQENPMTWQKSLEYSITSSIPLMSSPESMQEESFLVRIFSYVQKTFSTILWAMLVLSLRRKVRRGGE